MSPDDLIPDFHEQDANAPQRAEAPSWPDGLSWTPLKRGGSNFRTHGLKEVSSQRLDFRPTWSMLLFGGSFLLIGVGMFGVGMKGLIWGGDFDGKVIFAVIGLIIGGAGAALTRAMVRRPVFDQARGYYWKGRLPDSPAQAEPGQWARLDDIEGLQLLSEHVRGSESSYYSYELNLVLKDGRRLHVVDHGKADRLAQDAQRLAYFLGVPVWDRR